MIRDDSPTAAQIAAAAPPLSSVVRERLRQALMPAVALPPRVGRADVRRTAVVAARNAVSCLREHDERAGERTASGGRCADA